MVSEVVYRFPTKSELNLTDNAILEDHVGSYVLKRRLDLVFNLHDVVLRNFTQNVIGMF